MSQIEQYIRNLPGGDKYLHSQIIGGILIGLMLGMVIFILNDIYFATGFIAIISTIGFIIVIYYYKRSDTIFRESETSLEDAEVIPDQLKAQKARITDFFSKLDERFINKELSENNYKELKAKYEIQLKDIEKQIVETELHE
ncbi:MAG: hypothetical protein KKG76_06130 [Euryarchaeota archaeon]|nr:hypothetical protein [Euryarchaeota archaeon]